MPEQETTVIDSWHVIKIGRFYLIYYTPSTGADDISIRGYEVTEDVSEAQSFEVDETSKKLANLCYGKLVPVNISLGQSAN